MLGAAQAIDRGWQDLQLPRPLLESGWRAPLTPKCKERLGLLETGGGPLSTLPLAPGFSLGFIPQSPHISASPHTASGYQIYLPFLAQTILSAAREERGEGED